MLDVDLKFRPEPLESFSQHWSIEKIKPALTNAASGGNASDLRQFSPARHDQRRTGTCAANSTTRALEIKRIQKITLDNSANMGFDSSLAFAKTKHVPLSRLAAYFLAREQMTPPETQVDEGTYISLIADRLKNVGICREEQISPDDDAFWPFDEKLLFTSPSWLAMREAAIHKISAWYAIHSTGQDRVNDTILALAAGNPVVWGTQVGDQWSNYDGSILTLPTKNIGGHATVLVGYDPVDNFFWGENSWGDWGPYGGFYKMSPDVLASGTSSDFVVITGGWEPWAQVLFDQLF